MKTLTSTLTTAQQQSAIQPSVTATLQSNHWPAFAAHAVRIAPTNRDGDAVTTGTAIIRICNGVDGVSILYQRITNPDNVTDFYNWQTLVGGVPVLAPLAIFRAINRVVVAWLDSNAVKWIYSDDDGLTWSSTDTAAYAGAITSTATAIGGISSTVTQRGAIVIAYDENGAPDTYHLLLWRYNEGSNTWTSIGDYGGSEVSGEPDSVAGVYRTDSDDYCVALLIANDPSVTSFVKLIVLFHATASAWVAADTQTHSKLTTTVYDASNRQFIQMSQTKINGFYWLTFTQAYHDSGAVVVFLARSDDGLFYSAYVAAEIRAVQEKHVRMLEHGDYIYLIKPAEVWRAPAPVADVEATVVRYEFDGERMTIVLHDGYGTLAGSSLLVEGGLLSVERGAWSGVGAELVELHTFSIISVDIDGAIVTVKAETLLERMKRWVSEYTLTWTGTLSNLLERLAAWCDIHTVSVDGAAAWSNTITGFTVNAGQRGNQILARLQRFYPFLVEMDGDTLRATVAVASPAAVYDFDEHAGTIDLRTGFELMANQVFVYGLAPKLYEAFAYSPASFPRALHLTDRFLTSTALALARASAEILVQKERRRVGRLETLPHFGAQIGDVVTADEENWRIVGIAEKYRKPHGLKQVLTLRGTA